MRFAVKCFTAEFNNEPYHYQKLFRCEIPVNNVSKGLHDP